jgi:hypothetical protein
MAKSKAGRSAFRRVIVKVSGEALAGPSGSGIHQPTIDAIAGDLVAARKLGITLGVVVGGGNILRGVQVTGKGLSRPTADAMGMLATVMNAMVLEAAIERLGVPARTMSALAMPQVCEVYERQRALRHLDEQRVVVFAGGTGNPFFTTDTTAVLRAAEMGCDAVLRRPTWTASTAPTRKRTLPQSVTNASLINRRWTRTCKLWMPLHSRLPAKTVRLSSCSRSANPARSRRCCAARRARRSWGPEEAGGRTRHCAGPIRPEERARWQPVTTISATSNAACSRRLAC